ncbi:hypothetical protein ACLMAL_34750 [Nocardia sp. CWNU-33]|uniref:hypothetical protein n=1 Tax=Nocardia sp. CWNU-33 TaxID=3392117 RepID=UPI00398E66D0
MGAELDRVIGSLRRSLQHDRDSNFTRGMHYPTRWDSYFADFMNGTPFAFR